MVTATEPDASPSAPPLDPEVFDDEPTINQSGQLARLLRQWNEVVRAEVPSVQSFPVYDREAKKQQRGHQWLVAIAAITGSAAVLLAVLQLALLVREDQFGATVELLEGGEYVAAALALIAVGLGLTIAFHTRWQLLRMKAEQYRFLKFQFLLHAGGWAKRSEHEQQEYLRTLLAGVHALDRHQAHDWSVGVFALVDDDPAVIALAEGPLVEDMVRYFRERRIGSQRDYFSNQARKRHESETQTWMIPPACFFLSIICVLLHFLLWIASHPTGEAKEVHSQQQPSAQAESSGPKPSPQAGAASTPAHPEKPPPSPLMIACLFGAAAFPVIGAMVRTMRTAFEFGRNANRFEGVSRILTNVDQQLQTAASPAVKLELLREAEFVLQHENRSWMRLMIEAEWFG